MITGETATKIKNYVAQNKGWPESDYSIEYNRSFEGFDVFWVVHKDDLTGKMLGGGKSIELYISPVNGDIVKEMVFQ